MTPPQPPPAPTRTPYTSTTPLAHPAAADFVPKFLYSGLPDAQGRPDLRIRDDFYGTRRPMRIGVMGAGISGMQFLRAVRAAPLRDVEVVVYERNEDVGGVWLTSKYPGCRCDIASVVYQFSWRTNIWSEMYAPAAENLQYLKTVAREQDFYRDIKLRHEIVTADWTDEESKWTLRIRDLSSGAEFDDKVDVFVEFSGPVSNPRLNQIPGLEDFKGEVIHPAYWKDDTSVKGKRVALVGYGCSGVQIGPNIIADVEKLYTWFRNKTYVLPPPNQAFSAEGGANFKYSEQQKEALKDPDVYLAYRKAVENTFNKRYSYLINGGKVSSEVKDLVVNYMREKLASKPELLESLIPEDFDIGCRRQTFAYGYLEALTDPKTTVFPRPPQYFTAHGLLDAEGIEHPIDLVIAATGYDQSHVPRFPHRVNGNQPADDWAKSPSPPCYMASMFAGMPNYFQPAGAFGPLPQGNYYQSSEAFAWYIVRTIEKMQHDRIRSIVPKLSAVDAFVRHANSWMKRTALTGPCVAWYKGNDGISRPPSLWPGERSQFLKILSKPRFEDFEIQYEDSEDPFAFFGNGWDGDVHADQDAGDLSWYLGTPGRAIDPEVIQRLRGTDPSVKAQAAPLDASMATSAPSGVKN